MHAHAHMDRRGRVQAHAQAVSAPHHPHLTHLNCTVPSTAQSQAFKRKHQIPTAAVKAKTESKGR
eukprot:229655-Rhodomonas_salina.1